MIDSVDQPSAVLKLVVNSVTSAAIVLPVKRAAATREKSLIFFMVVKILEFVIRVLFNVMEVRYKQILSAVKDLFSFPDNSRQVWLMNE